MADLEESFAKLLDRQPTDADRQKLYQVRDALGLKSNDALWLVLMALQYYQGQYEAFPARIEAAAGKVLADVKVTANAAMNAASKQTLASLAKAITDTSQKVADDTSRKQKWRWACACIAVSAIAFGGFGWLMRQDGFAAGQAAGYSRATDEKAVASWANTPEGELAYRFAQMGEIQKLARCQEKGWQHKDGACFPQPFNGSIYGWKLP